MSAQFSSIKLRKQADCFPFCDYQSSNISFLHPTVWKLIECLQAECARVSAVLLQDERGVRPKKRIKKVYTELQGRLHNLCEDRSLGRKSIPDFLRGVSHNLRGGQPNI